MGDTRDLLEARNAAAMSLRAFDWVARSRGVKRMAGSLAQERHILCENLMIFGGQPWRYSSNGDNSWLVPER